MKNKLYLLRGLTIFFFVYTKHADVVLFVDAWLLLIIKVGTCTHFSFEKH